MRIKEALMGRINNFTLMRFFAALAVLYGHSYALSLGLKGGEDPISNFLIRTWGESLPSLSVDLFFVTSGFLVCASYIQRESLVAFVEARVLRIFPGLAVAVMFCIFLVGSLATTDSLPNYFLSPSTWSYFKHNTFLITGIQYDLPGVFITNPYPVSVNGSLWTLPIEVWLYFWVAILGSLSLLKDEKLLNLLFIILCLMYAQAPNNSFFIAHEPRNAHLSLLFMLGAFFYVNRVRLPLGFATLGVLAALVYLTAGYQFSLYVKSICFAYFVLLLALHPKLKLPSIDRWGDISYGLYIYAFPVQQSIAYLIPNVQPIGMFILSTVITVVLAILSWRLVEKPVLKMKGRILFGKHFDDVRAQ
jgi:peptidoglycan/LPS O-acetylase OafA/YrhL